MLYFVDASILSAVIMLAPTAEVLCRPTEWFITFHKVISVLLKHIFQKKRLIWRVNAILFYDGTYCGQIVPSCRNIALLVRRWSNGPRNIVPLVYTWYNLVAILYCLCTHDTILRRNWTTCGHLVQSRSNIVLPMYTWYNPHRNIVLPVYT